jgi:hypothetical protein
MDRFDLEEEIMRCWHVTDDLKTLSSLCDKMNVETIQKKIDAIEHLYDMKFNKLFDTFEKLINDGIIK